jgi:hypothetical protein
MSIIAAGHQYGVQKPIFFLVMENKNRFMGRVKAFAQSNANLSCVRHRDPFLGKM